MNDLHAACKNDKFNKTKNLLASNAFNIDEPTDDGWTSLMISSFQNHLRIVELLVQAGASLDAQNNITGRTAVMLAVRLQHVEVVKLLVRAGASLEIEDKQGITPLVRATIIGNGEILQALLRGGAVVEVGQKTALHYAAFGGNVDAFAMLVGAGAKLENPDETGRVALDIASLEGHQDVVDWMLSHTGIARCGGQSEGGQALWLAASTGHTEVMQLLTDFGVCSPSDLGKALLEAVHFCQEDSVKFLLKFDNYLYGHIQQALIWAIGEYKEGCASTRITRQLMEAGARTTDTTCDKDEDGTPTYETALSKVARLREKETEEKHVKRLDAIHRLLLQEDAVHSRSFRWPSLSSSTTAAATPSTPSTPASSDTQSDNTPAVVVRPVRRSREATSRVVKGALFRYSRKTMDTEVKKYDMLGEVLKRGIHSEFGQSEAGKEYIKALRQQSWWPNPNP